MKVYFTASARGTKNHLSIYRKIYQIIDELGNVNLDDLVCTIQEENFYNGAHSDKVSLYKKSMAYINAADVVVLEVSTHSLSMGYLMNKALDMGKPVIALYSENNDPYFAEGINNDKLQLLKYSEENLDTVLKSALEYAGDLVDVRFNFFISPAIGRYLDWVSKVKKIPRSVYLRALIEHEMEENKEYNDQ
ncbi:hypothetical protein KA082_00955 [Candidatus Woesebacteria bacterium]|nr:hypothetical protein [Candidatus Woesebacteria bacterium]